MLYPLFRQHKILVILFGLWIIIGGILLSFIQKGNEVSFFSNLHTPILNKIFIYLTQIAETPGVILFLAIVGIRNYRYLPVFLVNLIAMSLVVTFLKHEVFASSMRPSILLANKGQLNFVEGIEVMHNFSFPSGHTAAAFAMCFLFALLFRNTWLSFFMFIVATLVGISRLYLLQHFYEDVYAGAIVGMLLSFVVYYGSEKWKNKKLTI